MDDLPVGFRFYPTEEELLSFYLPNKLKRKRPQDIDRVIPLVDIYNYNPWDLPQFAGERCPADTEQWFFFTARQERETRGGRPNRLTEKGYWKATGSPCEVYSSTQNQRIGRKKTMVFYEGRAPNGRKTAWKMNEYKVFDTHIHHEPNNSSSAGANLQVREEISLCRIYKRSKCLRAFDRRPPTEEVAGGGQAAVHHHHQHETTNQAIRINNQENNNNPGVNIADQIISTNNSTSSSSGEVIMNNNNNPWSSHESLESENYWDLATDNVPLWDWEEFNWSDI